MPPAHVDPRGNPSNPIRLRRSPVTRFGIRAPRLSLLCRQINLNYQTVNKLLGSRTLGVLNVDSRPVSVNDATYERLERWPEYMGDPKNSIITDIKAKSGPEWSHIPADWEHQQMVSQADGNADEARRRF